MPWLPLGSRDLGQVTGSELAHACAGTPPEQHVLPWFVEDRTNVSPSYQDFVVALQKAVMAKT